MAKLGGALIGYGIKKRSGEEKKVIFDKPIHNTITKSCLNNLLTFDGTNAQPSTNLLGNYLSLFVKSSQASERYGVFNSAALGDGTGETSVNDTELKHRVTDATSTKKTGSGWCGTILDEANAIIKLRISHTHVISENFFVKEIGLYNQKWQELVYSLSARVQLDEGIPVESGDEFYSIYELTIEFQDVERFSDFAGLGGGYSVNFWASTNTQLLEKGIIPLIDTNGLPTTLYTYNSSYGKPSIQPLLPMYIIGLNYGGTNGGNSQCFIALSKSNLNKFKPYMYYSIMSASITNSVNGSSITNRNLHDYQMDSFRRDFSFTVSNDIMTGNVYAIICNGTIYRFGTFDENDNFTPAPVTINGALRITVRQRWSTDLLTPAG